MAISAITRPSLWHQAWYIYLLAFSEESQIFFLPLMSFGWMQQKKKPDEGQSSQGLVECIPVCLWTVPCVSKCYLQKDLEDAGDLPAFLCGNWKTLVFLFVNLSRLDESHWNFILTKRLTSWHVKADCLIQTSAERDFFQRMILFVWVAGWPLGASSGTSVYREMFALLESLSTDSNFASWRTNFDPGLFASWATDKMLHSPTTLWNMLENLENSTKQISSSQNSKKLCHPFS